MRWVSLRRGAERKETRAQVLAAPSLLITRHHSPSLLITRHHSQGWVAGMGDRDGWQEWVTTWDRDG